MKKRIMIVLIALFIIFGGLGGLYVWYDLSLNARPKAHGTEAFTVEAGTSSLKVARNLESSGIIKNAWVFFTYTRLNKMTLQAGDYELSLSSSIKDIARTISKGEIFTRRVTIHEGWTTAQIENYLADKKYFTKEEMDKALAQKYDYFFLAGRTGKESLEGFLFPDTYVIRTKTSAREFFDMMLSNMDRRLTPEIADGFKAQGLTLQQGVILASIVELEAQKKDDRAMVAGVLLGRMKAGMRLDADPTVRYATNNWDKELTVDDLNIDSPYNTRLNMGLPPGPISNPGADSLTAVAKPKNSGYLYYLSEKNGTMHYAKTLDEHNANAAKYLD